MASRARHRLDIQGLRAVAVLLVIANHFWGIPGGGYVGVDVFFVISGFVITAGLRREHLRSGRISLAGFYTRRVKRIMPAAILALVGTSVAAFLLLPRERGVSVLVDSFWSFIFSANWRMSAIGSDYFAEGLPPSPVRHFWSLSVEEQFYFVWPLLVIALLWIAARDGSKRHWPVVAVVLSLLMAVSLVWSVIATETDATSAYYSFLTRAWELGAGALLAIIAPRIGRMPTWLRSILAIVGLAAIAAAAVVFTDATPFPGWAAIVPVAGAAALIAAGTGAGKAYDRALWLLTNRVSAYIGDISYSLYLWHFPAIVLLGAVLPPSWWLPLVALGITAVLAAASYHLVENPLRRVRWFFEARAEKPRRPASLRAWGTVGALVAVGVFSLPITASAALAWQWRAPVETAAQLADVSLEPDAAQPCIGALSLVEDCTVPASTPISPDIDGLQNDTGNAYECYRSGDQGVRTCTFGSKDPDAVHVALIGDSHAAMYLPALTDIAKARNWTISTWIGNGCQWLPHPNSSCGPQADRAQEAISSGAYDLVITASSRDATKEFGPVQLAQAQMDWQQALDAGSKVVVIEDAPVTDPLAQECVLRERGEGDCGTERALGYGLPDWSLDVADTLPEVGVVTTDDLFCTSDDWCPSTVGRVVVFRDTGNHITRSYATTLAPVLQDRLLAALGDDWIDDGAAVDGADR